MSSADESFDPDALAAADPKKLSADQFGDLLAAAVRADASGGADGGLRAVDSRVLARLVSRASNDQLNAVMGSGLREPVLAEIFGRMGQQVRQDRTGGKTLVIRWRIGGRPDGGADEYQSVISDGGYRTEHPPEREPGVTITVGGADFLKLVTGNRSPVLMFMTGAVKVKGDLALAAGLDRLFDIPKA